MNDENNEVIRTIRERRSIRKYSALVISDDEVMVIIDAARLAPSGGNMQPWEFIVIRDNDRIRQISRITYAGFLKSGRPQKWIENAKALIVACLDKKRSTARYGSLRDGVIAFLDMGAAIENAILAAQSLGIGSCWVAGFDEIKLGQLLKLPSWILPVSIICMGRYDQAPASPPKLTISDILHWEFYGNKKASSFNRLQLKETQKCKQ